MEEINIFTLRAFKLMVDILINVLKNLKGNDKFDGMQYLLVSINSIKIKWSPIVSDRAITLKAEDAPVSSHLNNQTLSNIFKTKKENKKLIFNANNLNPSWIAQFFHRTLSEFVFDSVNLSLPSIKFQRALTNDVQVKDEEQSSLKSTSINISNETLKEAVPVTETHQKKVRSKKKQHSTYKCVLCEKRYLQRKPLLKHFSRYHVGFCSECGVRTGSKIEDIIEHKKIKHSKKFPFICDTCGEVFSRNQQFQVHLTIHERVRKSTKLLTCPQCNESFTKKYLYRKHLQLTKHQDKDQSMICELCGSQFNDNLKLSQHIKRVHNGITRKCQYCDQKFDQKCNLDRHMRLHTQVKKTFICEHCGDAYYTNEALKQHCITAHERRPKVACTICQKEFKNSRSLRIHIASHSDQRPFSCLSCPQAFKLKSHLSRHEKSVHGQLPARKKIDRLQPNEKGELVTVTEPQTYHRRPNEKLSNFQPFSNDSLFYSQGNDKEFQSNTINSAVCSTSNENIINAQLNDVHQFQIHQNNTNISDYVIDNLDIFHNCDAQHQVQTDFAFNETSSLNQQCYAENRHLNELDQNNWTNYMGNGSYNKSNKISLIELNSNEYMQISVPPMMQYQNAWQSDSNQMDISAAQSSQKVTYNNIGNILTNLELLGNNSNFDASNFELITSNREQQSKVILNDVNPSHPSTSHGMSYFNIQPIQQTNFIDLQANNLQSHTITDISNTYVTETQRNHLHQTRFFQNRDIRNEDMNKNYTGTSSDSVDPCSHQTAIVFPSLTDYLPNTSAHGFN